MSADPSVKAGLQPDPEASRRQFLGRLCRSLGGVCAAAIGMPAVGFVVAPLLRKPPGTWRTVGRVGDFRVGATVTVAFEDPSPLPWAGVTARAAAWLRREPDGTFTAFSVHCTHLGCPVRWLDTPRLFLCPCHGGVYYEDGRVAAGPPPLPLVRYAVRVDGDRVQILASAVPITTTR